MSGRCAATNGERVQDGVRHGDPVRAGAVHPRQALRWRKLGDRRTLRAVGRPVALRERRAPGALTRVRARD